MKKVIGLFLVMLMLITGFSGCKKRNVADENSSFGTSSTSTPTVSARPEKVTKVFSTYKAYYTRPTPLSDVFNDSQNGNTLPYCLFLPEDYSPSQKYPVILFLHGAGELGNDNVKQLNNINKMFTECGDFVSQSILICPQTAEWWNLDKYAKGDQKGTLGSALHLLQKIQKTYSCDNNRIYITGLSMGGYATWELLEHYGDIFAAGVPLCGFGNTSNGAAFKNTPIRIYHGTADPTVSYSSSQQMYNSIVAAGGQKVELFPLQRVQHDAWNYAYADRDMFSWMFAQNKATNPNGKYEYIPFFRVVDSNGKTIISDDNICNVDFVIDWERDGAVDIEIQLDEDGQLKLKNAYANSGGKEFAVYCSIQKLYTFTATEPSTNDLFVIRDVFMSNTYLDFYNAIKKTSY